jgi:Fe-S-cluster containining protein
MEIVKNIVSIPDRKLHSNDAFSFSCSKELECFNLCCRDINLFLTPYDILRIKRRLKIPSYEFLRTYTFPLFPEEVGHPVILMKMVPDETKNCPFVCSEGCLIYDDRPWSCRSFPLEPVSESPDAEFELVKRDFCLGFSSNKNHTIKKWRDTQNIGFYEEMNNEWKQLTHHENFGAVNLLQGEARDMFFLASYNIDEFRNMVFQGSFLDHFDIGKKILKKIRSDETDLMRFAFRWLRQILFGENTLKRR